MIDETKLFYDRFIDLLSETDLSWEKHLNRYWTKTVKDILHKMGKAQEFEVYPDKKRGNAEYMVDQCWAVDNKSKYYIHTAIEIEWLKEYDELEWDFSKLLDIKAYLKVFIYAPKEAEAKRIVSRFSQLIKITRLKLKDERYLLIGLFEDQNDLTKVEGYKISNNGKIEILKKVSC